MNFGFNFGFNFGLFGGVLVYPPVSAELLVWLKGNDDGTDQKLDSHLAPDAENFKITGSACVSLNGTDELGTTSIGHGAIESSEGTATVAYDGTTLSFSTAGTFYNVTFTDGTHYRIAENSGLTSFSDDYLTDGMSIVWSADVGTLWTQRQDTYPGNVLHGWWEITGDDVMYSYPVAGFDVHHEGGTWNDCESSYAPESFPINTFNGVDHYIALGSQIDIVGDFNISFCHDMESTKEQVVLCSDTGTTHIFWNPGNAKWVVKIVGISYDFSYPYVAGQLSISRIGAQLTFDDGVNRETVTCILSDMGFFYIGRYTGAGYYVQGIVRNVDINGTLIPINEGEGTGIHDSEGNVVGALSGDHVAFWAGAPMVAQSIIDAEAVQSSAILTDGDGHPEPRTQTWLEANLNVNEQYYITKCDGKNIEVWLYERLMNATEDFEILVASCNAEGVGVSGEQVGVNGVPVGVRI